MLVFELTHLVLQHIYDKMSQDSFIKPVLTAFSHASPRLHWHHFQAVVRDAAYNLHPTLGAQVDGIQNLRAPLMPQMPSASSTTASTRTRGNSRNEDGGNAARTDEEAHPELGPPAASLDEYKLARQVS